MLVKVTAIIEAMVQVDGGLTRIEACYRAKQLIAEGNFSALQADLQCCNPNEIKLTAKLVTKKSELSEQSRNWHAWDSNGGATSKTCGEILT